MIDAIRKEAEDNLALYTESTIHADNVLVRLVNEGKLRTTEYNVWYTRRQGYQHGIRDNNAILDIINGG